MATNAGDIVLVYHKPGKPSAVGSLKLLLDTLESLDIRAATVTIEEALENSGEYRGKPVFLLMFTRGGHWMQLVEAGLNPYTIPVFLTATSIGREARRRWGEDCSIALAALKTRRPGTHHDKDLEELRRLLSLYCSTRLVLLDSMSVEAGERYEYTVPLALLDGMLVEAACKLAVKDCLGPFIAYAYRDLAAWIAWTVAHIKQGGEGPAQPPYNALEGL